MVGPGQAEDAQAVWRASLTRFSRFACFDWSGAAVARPPGIALAIAEAHGPPRLIDRRWSRADVRDWLNDIAAMGEPMLIGVDLSLGFPFADEDAYFPGWPETPPDAKALWALVNRLSEGDPHLAATGFLADPDVARYFRQHGGRRGDRFGAAGRGRLRVCEQALLPALSPSSCLNLVGAAQVGKSSLTGMRVLHRLAGAIPVWPFDPQPPTGPVLVEIYTTIATRAAGIRGKLRTAAALDAALAALGSLPPAPLARYDDHATDATGHRRLAARQRRAGRAVASARPHRACRRDRRLDVRRAVTLSGMRAGLAQLVERQFCKLDVAGSIPATGTTFARGVSSG